MADHDSDAVAPLEGKTTIDDKMFFEPERLSYESAVAIAGNIATKIGAEIEGQVVVIVGTQLLVDLTNLQAVYLRLKSLRKEYSALTSLTREIVGRRNADKVAASSLEEAAAPTGMPSFANVTAGITPIGAAIQAAIGLVSLLREDVEYHGAKTTVDTLAFEIALADCLKQVSKAKRVFIPDLMVMQTAQKGGGSLQERLNGVQKARTDAWELIGPLVAELVRLEADLDFAVREKNEARVNGLTTRIAELRRDMQPVSDPLSRADRALAELQTQWNAADASSVSMLARLLRAEVIRAKNPRYVHAKVVSSGGHHRISRHLFRMLFLGDGLSFVGGATVRWALLNAEGAVVKGGVMVERRGGSSRWEPTRGQ